MLAAAVFAPVGTAVLVVHETAQNAAFYRGALETAQVHERISDEVLTDPRLADVTSDLLADLPVDPDLVVDNLQLVVPPSALRGLTDGVADNVAAYLDGSRAEFVLAVDLSPVLDNIGRLASVYLAGQVSGAPRYRTEDVAAALRDVLDGVDRVSQGRPPASIPEIELTDDQAAWVADLLLSRVAQARRPHVREQVLVALRSGDLGEALALVGPLIFAGDVSAVADLRARLAGGAVLDLGRPLSGGRGGSAGLALRTVHRIGGTGMVILAALCFALPAWALVRALRPPGRAGPPGPIGRPAAPGPYGPSGRHGPSGRRAPSYRPGPAAALRTVSLVLIAAGATATAASVGVTTAIGDPLVALRGPDSPLPPAGQRLLADVGQVLVADVRSTWLAMAVVPLVAGGVLATVSVLASYIYRARGRFRRLLAVAGAALMFLGVSWTVLPGRAGTGTAFCNGGVDLCARRYPDVLYPTTHNGMASVRAGFLGAVQDPDLVGQLDSGIRALMLDVHHWTTPAEVESFLGELRPAAREALAPFATGARSERPGLWLCHGICQLGATALDDALAGVAGWLARNPAEVITLILQDEVPPEPVMAAFRAAGLGDYLARPPAPGRPWPTLGQMIDRGRRLVVFAENGDVPGTWYRNFFRLNADTPFDVRIPGGFSCRLGRGNAHPRMLLINHWLTDHAATRADAALVNTASALAAHTEQCAASGLRPTFLAVNFATVGDLVQTVANYNLRRPR
ncbi:hypothetical protein ACG83_11290 [Frankia sp. R43]|uniref:hypothetical protein n=1 Tax=Frankia sp. R43 TaxID=269536 RepID=UPI0006CA2357|nr:hypothetical protein [Frankia sp. R43]KPM55836.1 hypothetical protein ACG83_11290 [Frankia sp. R43]